MQCDKPIRQSDKVYFIFDLRSDQKLFVSTLHLYNPSQDAKTI